MTALVPSAREAIVVGGRLLNDLDKLKVFSMQVGTALYSTFRDGATSSGYVVPTGKKLVVLAVKGKCQNNSTGQYTVLYGGNDVGIDSGGSPTDPAYILGTSSAMHHWPALGSEVPYTYEAATYFEVPAGQYPCFKAVSVHAMSADIYCYLEDE